MVCNDTAANGKESKKRQINDYEIYLVRDGEGGAKDSSETD